MGSITSSVATVSVIYFPPTLDQQPIGGNVVVGSNFVLTAAASGTAPLNWQWRTNGTLVSGANASSYTINSAQLSDAGSYVVVVTNIIGSVTSSIAVVNVGYVPVVVQQPLSLTNSVSGTATFSCVVTGSAPINLQWTFNGGALTGATNSTLTLTNLQSVNIGYYALTATNIFGGTLSSNAVLNLVGYDFGVWNGLVAYYPFNGNANDASGNGNNGTNFGAGLTGDRFGNTNSAYAFYGTNWIDVGAVISQYELMTLCAWFKTTNAAASKENGILTKLRSDGGIGARLGVFGGTVDIGFNNYAVNLTGFDSKTSSDGVWHQAVLVNDTSSVRLYVDGLFAGQTAYSPNGANSSLSFVIGNDPSSGNRFFDGQIDDARIYNRALSSNEVARLFATEADMPVITQQPQAQTANIGSAVTFTVAATANHPLAYQWFKDGVAVSSATNTSLILSNLQPSQIGYYSVVAKNGVAGVTSTNAALNLNGYNFAQWRGLVAYFPFNGNANDASGNDNSGTNFGAVLTGDRFGNTNSAYSFDGVGAYIQCKSAAYFGSNFTITAWVNAAAYNDWSRILDFGNGAPADNTGIVLATPPSHQPQFFTEVGAVAGFNCISPTIIPTNVWIQVVATCDGNSAQLYMNGVSQVQIAAPMNRPSVLTTSNYFGKSNWNGDSYLAGILDDIRIYNHALSSNEVASIFALEADVPVITQQPQAQTVSGGRSRKSFSVNLVSILN